MSTQLLVMISVWLTFATGTVIDSLLYYITTYIHTFRDVDLGLTTATGTVTDSCFILV